MDVPVPPIDFLAATTQHIPDKGAQMVRYYGWYSNKMRGVRQRGLPPKFPLATGEVCLATALT